MKYNVAGGGGGGGGGVGAYIYYNQLTDSHIKPLLSHMWHF